MSPDWVSRLIRQLYRRWSTLLETTTVAVLDAGIKKPSTCFMPERLVELITLEDNCIMLGEVSNRFGKSDVFSMKNLIKT